MPLWTKTNQANGAPRQKHVIAANVANGQVLFANITPSAFIPNQIVGVYGIDKTEINSSAAYGAATSGWCTIRFGTGPVNTLAINAAGTGYSNTNLIKVSGGTVNAAGTLVTNSTGGLTSVAITTPGSGFSNVATTTVAVTNSTGGATGIGTGATFVVTLGGRAGRVQGETLVALSRLSADANTNGMFP
jgi:hypothetical protein